MAHTDPHAYWLLARVLGLFDPQTGDDQLAYEGLLWRLQALNSQPTYPPGVSIQAKPMPEPTTDEEEQAMRDALGYFAPQPEDGSRSKSQIALRLLEVIDRELMRCTSGPQQWHSPTGAVVLPLSPL